MRTTLIIRDDLIEAAKKCAAERKMTLSAIVDEALMMAMNPTARIQSSKKMELPTYAPPGAQVVDVSPEKIDELMVAEERETYGESGAE